MSIPDIKTPKYEVIDLSAFDEEYKGQEVRVLVNPSRAFRIGYIKATNNVAGDEFIEYIAAILGGNEDEVQRVVEDMPADVFQWLFCFTWVEHEGNPVMIRPRVLEVWDERIVARVKARAALPKASAQPSAS